MQLPRNIPGRVYRGVNVPVYRQLRT